jgi:hypothetical protein
VGTGAEGSFLQGPLVAARRALVMETAVKSRRIMWSLSSLFELCILWYYCFCLLDFLSDFSTGRNAHGLWDFFPICR